VRDPQLWRCQGSPIRQPEPSAFHVKMSIDLKIVACRLDVLEAFYSAYFFIIGP